MQLYNRNSNLFCACTAYACCSNSISFKCAAVIITACFYTDEPSPASHASRCAAIPLLMQIDCHAHLPSHSSHSHWTAYQPAYWTPLYKKILSSKSALLNGSMINAAQNLLKKQAAGSFVGFQNVALGMTLQFGIVEKDHPFIQILFANGNHWLATTNAGCPKGKVKIFDSAFYGDLALNTKNQICSFLQPQGKRVHFHVLNIQTQHDRCSCGLFAIAVAVELVAGGDPTTCEWKVTSMREHLAMCLQQEHLTPFPQIKKSHVYPGSRIRKVVEEDICCKCRMPADTCKVMNKCDKMF